MYYWLLIAGNVHTLILCYFINTIPVLLFNYYLRVINANTCALCFQGITTAIKTFPLKSAWRISSKENSVYSEWTGPINWNRWLTVERSCSVKCDRVSERTVVARTGHGLCVLITNRCGTNMPQIVCVDSNSCSTGKKKTALVCCADIAAAWQGE